MNQTAGARLGGQGQAIELLVPHAEDPLGGVEHARAVEGAGQRQVGAGGVGETGHQTAGIMRGRGGDGRDDAASPQGHARAPGPQPQSQSGPGVVPAAGSQRHMRQVAAEDVGPAVGDDLPGAGHARQDDAPDLLLAAAQGQSQQVTAVHVAHGIEVPGPGGIRAIGDELVQRRRAREPPGQPIVRQADGGDARGGLGLVVGQPPQLGDRQ